MSDLDKLREMSEKHQERLEALRDEISFEDCQEIKRAGELYRVSGSIEAIADDLGVSEKEAKQLVANYITIVNNPTDQCDFLKTVRGVRFYGGRDSLEELRDENDTSEEEIELGLRDFVGLTLDENEAKDTEISVSNIPEDAVYPPSVIKTARQTAETVQKVAEQTVANFEMIAPQLKRLDSMTQRMAQTLQQSLLPLQESFAELGKQFRSRIAEAIRDGISNFESPDRYDPSTVEVNQLACEVAIISLEKFIETIREEEAESLYPYLPRLEAIVNDYNEGNYFTPIYAAISVQDGLMHWLCEQAAKQPEATNRFGEPHYKWNTKKTILASRYEGWYDVGTGDVIPNFEEFYRHRNAIMHGDPLAYFDENIATISILFLNLTLYTVIDVLDEEQ